MKEFISKILHNRHFNKNVEPNRNENGFMDFVNDYVKYQDFNKEI